MPTLAQDLNLLCSVYQLRRTSVQRTLCACVPKIITTFPTPPPDITGVNREARLVRDTLLSIPVTNLAHLIHGLKETSPTRSPEGINRLSAVLTYNGDAN
jgi:hypothetical protein